MEKIKELLKKVMTKEVILYIIFGLLTTVCNIGVFTILNKIFNIEENLANFIAIFVAVIFAYLTNKDWVFHSDAGNFNEKIIEFGKFMLGRAFTMVIEFGGCWLLFAYLPIPNIISKCIMTVIVIILNFFISKFFAFSKKENA